MGPPTRKIRSSFPLAICAAVLPGRCLSECSNIGEYTRWAASWTETCRPASIRNGATVGATQYNTWFTDCDWVSCDCINHLALTPVPMKELAPCFEMALSQNSLVEDAKLMITALMRTCRAKTDHAARPCGECDKYRDYRGCIDGNVPVTTSAPINTTLTETVPASGARFTKVPSTLLNAAILAFAVACSQLLLGANGDGAFVTSVV